MKRRRKSVLWSRGCALTMTGKASCACYMLHKCWTGAYCRYFREAVLPLDLELQAALTTEGIFPEQNCNMIDGVPNNTPIPPAPSELDAKPLDKLKEPKEHKWAGIWNADGEPKAECPSARHGDARRAGGNP